MTTQQRKLFRSTSNRVFAGICGGFGEYMNVDPTIVRLVWILLTLLGGSGLLLYLVLYFVIPRAPYEPTTAPVPLRRNFSLAGVFGAIFIAIGIIVLLDNLDLISFHHWWCWGWEFFFPGILILAGIFFLTRRERTIHHPEPPFEKKDESATAAPAPEPQVQEPPFASAEEEIPRSRKLHRSTSNKKFLGVCSGLAEYFGLDVTIVRVAYVIFTILSTGVGFILYALLYLILPDEESTTGKQ